MIILRTFLRTSEVKIPQYLRTFSLGPKIRHSHKNKRVYMLLFTVLPSACFQHSTWTGIFADPEFKEILVEVAIGEAHCITRWYVLPFIKLKMISGFIIFLSLVYN